MKRIQYISAIVILAVFGFMNACSDEFLEVTPNGALSEDVLATADGVDALLIGAYSMLDGISDQGTGGWEATTSGWVYGSIRGLEANKGTDSGDQPDINPIQQFTETSTNPYLNLKWRSLYEAISRCNSTISVALKAFDAGTITDAQYDSFTRQARALRGFYHFEAYRLWADMSTGTGIPYVDEKTVQAELKNDQDVRGFIIADLEEGRKLDQNMGQVGRFNKTVGDFLWAKAQMQMNGAAGYAAALPVLTALDGGAQNPVGQTAQLETNYGDIFDAEFRNGVESIYTVQFSVNDGSGGWNGGWGEVLNFPYKSGASPGGCCGFFQPTQEFVNSFRTSAGLPLLDNSYNNSPVLNDQGLAIDDLSYVEDPGPLDPRLDWTVGRRGIPYLDWGDHTGQDWIRDQSYAGPFSPKKQVYKQSQEGQLTEVGNWTSGWTANGYRLIRFADVLLLKAEAEAVTGSDDRGFGEINRIRARAANSAGFVKEADGTTDAANYVINTYTQAAYDANPIAAIQMERKLELGMEGHRYYDLQRWDAAGAIDMIAELNRALTYEKTMPWADAAYGGTTVGAEDKNYPIPQRQIDLANGNLTQRQ